MEAINKIKEVEEILFKIILDHEYTLERLKTLRDDLTEHRLALMNNNEGKEGD